MKRQKNLQTIVVIGAVIVIIVAMVVNSSNVENFSLSFFGTRLSIDKK